nr:DUF58 domain-containing protein [Paenibacillus sp. NEAU-GSW1]
MLIPTTRLAALAGAGAALIGAGYAVGLGAAAFLLVNGLLLVLSIIDLSLMPRRKSLKFTREIPEKADIHSPFEVNLKVESAQRHMALKLEFNDDVPQSFLAPERKVTALWRGRTAEARYTTLGKERGRYRFRLLRVRMRGTLGLWMKQTAVELEHNVHIYPDLSGVRGILSSAQNHLTLEGKRIYRKERSGSEFHAIRDYVPDDDLRMVNWRASARSRNLMTNVYRPERGKSVILMIDCGRMMGVELDGRTKLDASLEAALSLAAVALRQGDKVGLLAFSAHIKAYVPPGAGVAHLSALTEAAFDLQSDFVEASYNTALQYFMKVQKKRSFVVLFSDLDNYMYEEGLRPLLKRANRQHHLLLLGLRDEVLHKWTLSDTKTRQDAFVKSIAHKLTLDRRDYAAMMEAEGIDVVDVPVGELAWTAVNRYLVVKADDLV